MPPTYIVGVICFIQNSPKYQLQFCTTCYIDKQHKCDILATVQNYSTLRQQIYKGAINKCQMNIRIGLYVSIFYKRGIR